MPRTRTRTRTRTTENTTAARTHGGAFAAVQTPEEELRRTVLANLLFQSSFYEDGRSTADRLAALVPQVPADVVARIAIDARDRQYLRHVPLQLCVEMSKHASHKHLVASTLAHVIQRPDELTEFCALYWAGRTGRPVNGQTKMPPLSKQVRKGLAQAFGKFNAYSLAKYNKDGPVKLKDVLFLAHAKPNLSRPTDEEAREAVRSGARQVAVRGHNVLRHDSGQGATWQQLIAGTLPTPDTWETQLSAGADKRATFERLIAERKLGALALIRNLRGMSEAGVSEEIVRAALVAADLHGILPHQVYSAYREAPQFANELEALMFRSARELPRLAGTTALIVDCSGSMHQLLSPKGRRSRQDAAGSLAAIMNEICERAVVYATADRTARVQGRGMELAHNVAHASVGGGGIYTHRAVEAVAADQPDLDRAIIITDGQDCDYTRRSTAVPDIADLQYTINVATDQHGITYGENWLKIDGWSDHVVRYVAELEAAFARQIETA